MRRHGKKVKQAIWVRCKNDQKETWSRIGGGAEISWNRKMAQTMLWKKAIHKRIYLTNFASTNCSDYAHSSIFKTE